MKTVDNHYNELNILDVIESIIKEMDSDLTKYSQRRNWVLAEIISF